MLTAVMIAAVIPNTMVTIVPESIPSGVKELVDSVNEV
jgi:hypothetical protein